MSFIETIRRARDLLREEGRISVRSLKREFDLDDEALDELVEELVDVQQVAAREGRILSWIGAAQAEAPAPAPETRATPVASSEAAAAAQPPEAERRQLTVMFCDLVGSTELSERLDAEDLAEVVAAYQQMCVASIESFDGHVAQYLGDGLLVYFGYPMAHEDDAMRAIHAALGIVHGSSRLNERLTRAHPTLRERPLRQRIGIHTGPVVVGEMGAGKTREHLALGGTVNVAARLEAEAEPGSILVSGATRHLVHGAFVFEALGERSLKGVEEKVAVFRPVQPTGVQSRLALAGASGLTPLVGREQEVGVLLERWEEAKAGRGQVVLLSGEAGMGKSRLIEVLRKHVADEAVTWHEYRGSAYHQDSAFHPVIELIERAVMFTEADPPEARLAKLARGLEYSGFPTDEILPLIAHFLRLPQPEGLPPLALSPEARRRKTLQAIAVWPVALAQRQPMIVIGEDLHWWDPSSLEVGGMAVEQVPAAPILLMVTFRPQFELPWPSPSRWMHLPLQPLTDKHVEAMARHFTGGKPLPREVRKQIVARTDGVPLFVEELTKTVLESGLVVESDAGYERSDPLPPQLIPSTLRDSLTARLDRLGPAKEVIQLAAVLGREFSHELLETVSLLEPAALERALRELVGAGLLYQRGIPPRASYIFKHALIQEAAYQSLLKRRRREYHALVAGALEEHFEGRAEARQEVVARHYEHAGRHERAISCYQAAGERATRGSANAEAVGSLTKAIELLRSLPEDGERDEHELVLQLLLGTPLVALNGWASPDAERTYKRALELSGRVGEAPQRARALSGLHGVHNTRGELTSASEVAERLLRLASGEGDISLLVMAHHLIGVSSYLRGRLRESLEHWDQAIALHDPNTATRHATADGTDAGTSSRIWAAFALWQAGYPDQALHRSREGVDLARSAAHPFTLAYAVAWNAAVHLMRRERDAAMEAAGEAIALSEEQGFPTQLLVGRLVHTRARSDGIPQSQEIEQCLASLEEVFTGLGTLNTRAGAPQVLGILADVCRELGRTRDALAYVDGGLSLSADTGQPYWDAELQRLKGEAILEEGHASEQEAERLFHLALDISRNQTARSLELRSATSLGRLWHRQRKPAEARSLLAPIYSWFTEGFDTPDLKDAKALLEELA